MLSDCHFPFYFYHEQKKFYKTILIIHLKPNPSKQSNFWLQFYWSNPPEMKNANTIFSQLKWRYVGSQRYFSERWVFLLSQTVLYIKSTEVLAKNFVVVLYFCGVWNFLLLLTYLNI